MARLVAVILLSLLPTVLTAVGLILGRADARRPAPRMPLRSGPWIERTIARLGWPIAVEVVPADSPDAYWPNVDALALSERTWAGDQPRDWAIAAHELGHARTTSLHPALRWVLPSLRLVAGLGWRATVGAMVAGVLLREPTVLAVGWGALVVSVAASALVCVDEIAASVFARALLAADPDVSEPALARATFAMGAAGGAYVLGAAGQLGILVLWPLTYVLAGSGEVAPLRDPNDLGIWLTLMMVPVVVVRTALVLQQVFSPEPVPTDLDLWALLARESQWEWVCAVGALSIVGVLHDALAGPVLGLAVAAAVAASLGAVHGVFVAVLALPGVVVRRFLGEPRAPSWPRRARDDVPQAMIALWSDPPWYLRVAWMVPLAYVPLVGLLVGCLLIPR